ncbi:MAG: sugar transferase [Candidatus Omnitrophota bacterium]|nr:sugar transferase [Candidatus Omnitrophota bacterium]
MIKEKEALLRKLMMATDVAVIAASFFAAVYLRQNIHAFYRIDLIPGEQVIKEGFSAIGRYLNILPFILFAWWASLTSSGLYESFRRKHFFEIVWGILKSAFFVMLVLGIVEFIFKLEFISRALIAIFFSVSCLSLIAERLCVVSFLRYLRRHGYNYKNVLIVGTGDRAQKFIKLLHRHSEWGFKIAGLIDADSEMLGKEISGEKVIGVLDDMPRILHENVIDEVMFIVPRKWLSIIEKSLLECEIEGVKTNIAADFFNLNISRAVSTDIESMPLLSFTTTVGEEWQLLLKRVFDIILSLTGIALALPIFLTLAVMIRSMSGGPAIFRQVRSGLGGRKFIMYKFRTMVDGAEKMKDSLNGLNEIKGPAFKMKNDPRVTRFGAFLRRSSLDELPQLFNVLKGEMSIVGPRPPIPAEVENYQIWQRRRLSMKPGLTCLWQANGRNNVDFEKWMKLDLEYIDSWSLGLDFKIMLKTVPAVLFSIGAR